MLLTVDNTAEFLEDSFLTNYHETDKISRTFIKERGTAKIPYEFTARAKIYDLPLEDTANKICLYLQESMIDGTKYQPLGCSDAPIMYKCSVEEVQGSMLCKYATEAKTRDGLHYYELSEHKRGNEQHKTVQDWIMLADRQCLAIELPVYCEKQGRSGFIDVLRYYNERLVIADFKPSAKSQKQDKVMTQLILYRKMLSVRTRIPEDKIDCCYFDKDNCYKLVFSY
jgi:hypothetical protein